jgi:hypothetical protein
MKRPAPPPPEAPPEKKEKGLFERVVSALTPDHPTGPDAETFRQQVGRYPENQVELDNFKATPNDFRHPSTRPNGPIEQFVSDVVSDPARRGFDKATQELAFLTSPFQSKEGVAQAIAAAQADMPPPLDPKYQAAADAQLKANPSLLGRLSVLVKNPRLTLAQVTQGMAEYAPTFVAQRFGGNAGAAGAAYLQGYSEAVLKGLQQNGVDLSDKDAVLRALNDPELMDKAKAGADAAGAQSGITTLLSFGLAGRLYSPVGRAVARPVLGRAAPVVGKVAGVGAEVGAQAGIGASGEAGGQLYAHGRITDPGAVAQAAVNQVPLAAMSVAHLGDPLDTTVARTTENRRATPMEAAQEDAAQASAATGGDPLDQVVAATHAEATVGAHYHAAEVHATREPDYNSIAAGNADAFEAQGATEEAADAQAERTTERAAKERQETLADEHFEPLPPETPKKSERPPLQQSETDPMEALAERKAAEDVAATERQPAASSPAEQAWRDRVAKAQQGALAARREAAGAAPAPVGALEARREAAASNGEAAAQNSLRTGNVVEVTTGPNVKNRAANAKSAEAHLGDVFGTDDVRPATSEEAAANKPVGAPEPRGPVGALKARREAAEAPAPESNGPAGQSAFGAKREAVQHGMLKAAKRTNEADRVQATIDELRKHGIEVTHEQAADLVRSRDRVAQEAAQRGEVAPPDTPENAPVVDRMKARAGAAVPEHVRLQQRGEASAQQEGRWQKLMGAPTPEAAKAVVDKFPAGEAQAHLDRLDAAPGDNALARGALEARVAQDRTADRPTLKLRRQEAGAEGDKPVEFADSSAPRVQAADVEHTVGSDGLTHTAESPNGKTVARALPEGGNWQLQSTETRPGARAQGEGVARVERLAAAAHAHGAELESGSRVSPASQRVWNALKERGWPIETRPHDIDASTGEAISRSELKGVHSITGPRDLSNLNGMALKRLAAQGDTAARDELARRSGAPDEKPTFADRRAANAERTEEPAEPPPRRNPPVRKEEMQKHLAPMAEKLKARGIDLHVHDGLEDEDVSPKVRQQAEDGNHQDVKGWFDPTDGSVHLVAGARDHVTAADGEHTLAHELVHKGLRSFLGKEGFDRTMLDVYENIHNDPTAVRSPIPGVNRTTAREWTRDYLSQHGYLDDQGRASEAAKIRASEEYISSLAEQDMRNGPGKSENPSLLRYVMDGLRKALRAFFRSDDTSRQAPRVWTDDHLRQLIKESLNDHVSPHAKDAAERYGDTVRFADSNHLDEAERYEPDDPRSIGAKYDATVNLREEHNPGYVRSRKALLATMQDKFGALLGNDPNKPRDADPQGTMGVALSTQQLDSLPSMVNPNTELHAAAKRINAQIVEREVRSTRLAAPGRKLLEDRLSWALKNPELDAKLQKLMADTTLARVDPSHVGEDGKPKFTRLYSDATLDKASPANRAKMVASDRGREEAYPHLVRRYNELGEQGQEFYRHATAINRGLGDAQLTSLDKRAEALGVTPEARARVQRMLGRGRIDPYHVLARRGPYWGGWTDQTGRKIYSRFENNAARNAWEAEQIKAGAKPKDMKGGTDTYVRDIVSKLDGRFFEDAREAAKTISDDKEREAFINELSDIYLDRMPNNSLVHHSRTREGIAGFDPDMWRGFAEYTEKAARNIAGNEHNPLIDKHLKSIQEAAAKENTPEARSTRRGSIDAQWATALQKEYEMRRGYMDDEKSDPLARAITRGGFDWYLSLNPASAERVLEQNMRNAAPALGAAHGFFKGRGALWGANFSWFGHHFGNLLEAATLQRSKIKGPLTDALRGDERKAMEWVRDSGTFSMTQVHSLTATNEPGMIGKLLPKSWRAAEHGTDIPNTWQRVINATRIAKRALFTVAELRNRETTALAAIRLKLGEGASWQEAARYGRELSNMAHYDYSRLGRPRIVTTHGPLGGAGPALMQFRQYDLGQINREARDASDWLTNRRDLSPEMRREAASRFIQMKLANAVLHGLVRGSVLSTIALMLYNRFASINEGQPWGDAVMHPQVDGVSQVRDYLTNRFGKTVANIIIDGVPAAIPGVALTGSDADTYLPYTRDDPKEGVADHMRDLLTGLVPGLSRYIDYAHAADQLVEGKYERAFEGVIPHGPRNAVKTVRVANQGLGPKDATPDLPNTYVKPPHSMTLTEKILMGAGFQLEGIHVQYETNAAAKAKEVSLQKQVSAIDDAAYQAIHLQGDERKAAVDLIKKAVDQYNAHLPRGVASLKGEEVFARAREKDQRESRAVNGVSMPKSKQGLVPKGPQQ